MNSKQSVALVDPQPVIQEGIRALVATTTDLELAWCAESLPAALDLLRRTQPSVLLVDGGFGRNAVLEFLRESGQAQYYKAIVVWGSTMSQAEGLQFLQAGAMGIGRKSIPLAELLAGLRSAASHMTWISAGLRPALEPDRAFSRASLTRREQEVLDRVLEGKTTRQIAVAIGVQPGTVKVHLRKIFEKTGIHSRFGLSLAAEPRQHSASASNCA